VDPGAFCAQARLLIVAGKGGVGKTTVTAAVARLAARAGLNALIIDMEGKSGLGNIFGYHGALTYHEVVLAEADGHGGGEVRARTLTPDDALLEYLSDHGMNRISKRLASTGALDVVATAAPGIKDILVLGKVKQLERASANRVPGAADLLVLDAPAAGHAFTFLASAQGLMDAVSVGPIRAQAADVLDMLSDPTRCQVMLVTLPEETPVNEVVETAFKLEDHVGVHLTPIVVNGLYPHLELGVDPAAAAAEAGVALTGEELERLGDAAAFRTNRQRLQAEQTGRLADALPLPQLHLPFLFTTELGVAEVDALAAALAAALATLPEADVAPSPSPSREEAGDGAEGGGAPGNGKASVKPAAGPGAP
jgi:anion-transporting  ArsA/GET3 family ATPase